MALPASDRAGQMSPRTMIGLIVGIAILLTLMVIAFALPASRSAPHDVPIGVVAPAAQAAHFEQGADGFAVTAYPDQAAATDAILDREIYGAVVFGANGPETVVVSSAASPAVATLLGTVGQRMGITTQPVDVQGFPADDPKGAGLAAGALPLALGGWIGAMVIMLLIPGNGARLVAAAGVSVAGGLALVATLQFVIGTFDGNYWVTSLAAMLGIAATCFMVLGLRELLGGIGLGIAAVLLIFLGNPLSGLQSAPELLPAPWGTLGQLLPPGATGMLLRDVVFFEGHGIARSIMVLCFWLVLGLALYGAGIVRARRKRDSEPADQATTTDGAAVAVG
ncbi:hypothetical protein [Gordonia hankookensis]|uniref:ABC transporter permease n=1 Tax=Gordonia hankookensis TaxID=589403 RepID=A0ABR7WBY5_9ACTN|nr:hypothetical protein [Gordonia hankookensis]MBD1320130.1 hypothetical protein [Gordonia hankookensis]